MRDSADGSTTHGGTRRNTTKEEPTITADNYFTFVAYFLLAFGITFSRWC